MKPRDMALAVLVTMIWGFNFVVIKVGLESFPPILFVTLRFTLAAVPAVYFLRHNTIPWKWLLGVGLFLGAFQFSLLFIGMNIGMPAGLSSLVLQCQAIFTLMLSSLVLKDTPTRWQCAGVLVAFSGMGVLISEMSGSPSFAGLLLVIAAGFCWGVGNICIKRAGKVDMLALVVLMSLVPPLPMLGLSLAMETGQWEAITNISWLGIGVLAYIVILSTHIGFGLWGWLFREYSANMVAPFSLLVPVWGLISASIVLNEHFSHIEIAASCLVLSGIFLVVFGNRIVGWLRLLPSGSFRFLSLK